MKNYVYLITSGFLWKPYKVHVFHYGLQPYFIPLSDTIHT